MTSSNQIEGLFDHQYLWKERMDIHVPSHAQNHLDLPRVHLDSIGGIARLKLIQNERSINF